MILENVQPGDTLIWHTDYGRRKSLLTIDRITKTLVVSGCHKFQKSDGENQCRDKWNRSRATIPEKGEITVIRNIKYREKLIERIAHHCTPHSLKSITLTKLEQLNQVLETP